MTPARHEAKLVTQLQVIAAIKEFEQVVDAIYGIYLDSTLGFNLVRGKEDEVRQLQAEKFHFAPEQSDNAHLIYGRGNPNNPESQHLHECTRRELRERNGPNGLNYKFIGNLCLVLVYQYWDDHYRPRIEREAGLPKDAMKSNLWGDIRQLRRSIIHNKGKAIDEVANCSVLTWFKAGDEISVSDKQFELLISYVKNDLNELPQKIRYIQSAETRE